MSNKTITVELEPVIEAKLSGFLDGLAANLTIIKDEYERVLCLFQQANKAKREYFANWQAAAAENRRLVGIEQDRDAYKQLLGSLFIYAKSGRIAGRQLSEQEQSALFAECERALENNSIDELEAIK